MKPISKQFAKARANGFSNAQMGYIRAAAAKETQNQIDEMRKQETERAFLYMLAIPLNVLINDYWPKAPKKKLQDFMMEVCKLYSAVEAGVVTDEELADFLHKKADYEVQADWLKGRKETNG